MADLKETIEMVLEKVKNHRDLYEKSEESVRQQIINPILRELGWDPENPEEVQPDISTGGWPDYTLLKNGKEVLFVEAERLRIDVEKGISFDRLWKYCIGKEKDTMYGVLSNGVIWILFRGFPEGAPKMERILWKMLWKVDLEKDDMTASVRRLNTIAKENIENIGTLAEKIQVLDKILQSLLDDPEEIIKELIPVFENLIRKNYPDYGFSTFEIEEFIKERARELVLPQTKIVPAASAELERGEYSKNLTEYIKKYLLEKMGK